MADTDAPLIVLTVADIRRYNDPELAARKNDLYAEAVVRHGGRPILLDGTSTAEERAAAFAAMDGLLLTGGTDIDPARYGRPNTGSVDVEPDGTRSRRTPGRRPRRARCRSSGSAAASRRSTSSPAGRSSRTSGATRGRAGAAGQPGCTRSGSSLDGILARASGERRREREHVPPPGSHGRRPRAGPPGDRLGGRAPSATSSRRSNCRAIASSSGSSAIPNERNSARRGSSACGPRSSAAAADVAARGARRRSPAAGTAASAPRAAR